MRLLLAAVASRAATVAAPAQAAPVLQVRAGRDHVVRDDPYLPPRAETDLPRPRRRAPPAPRAAGSGDRRCGRRITRASRRARSRSTSAREYRAAYSRALSTRARPQRARAAPSSARVIETLEAIARADQLDASRMPALFLQLERNTEYWPSRPTRRTASGSSFAGSELVFQHYSGQGLQIQPLANFGKANALWRDGRAERLALAASTSWSRSRRAAGGSPRGSTGSRFGGGRPPWMSGMAQGTAIQALSRGVELLGDPSYLRVARRGDPRVLDLAAGRRARAGRDGGNHYLHLLVLARAAGAERLHPDAQRPARLRDDLRSTRARMRAVREGRRVAARASCPRYDTGAWTLYSLGGPEATLEYHALATRLPRQPLRAAAARRPTATRHARFEALPGRGAAARAHDLASSSRTTSSTCASTLSKRSSVRMTISRGGRCALRVGACRRTARTPSPGRPRRPVTTS